jgi:hypothetical protein
MFGQRFEWWAELPPLLRVGMALLMIAIGVVCFFAQTRGWTIGLLGIVLLLFSGPSGPEKKGYRW